jgi:hypothetical protein
MLRLEVYFQGKWRSAIYLADVPVPEGKIVAEPIGFNCCMEFELSQWRLTDSLQADLTTANSKV